MDTSMSAAFERAAVKSVIVNILYANAVKAIRCRGDNLDKAAEDVLREIQLSGNSRDHLNALALGFVRFVDRDMKGASPSTLSPQGGVVGHSQADQCDNQTTPADNATMPADNATMPPRAAGAGHHATDDQSERAGSAQAKASEDGANPSTNYNAPAPPSEVLKLKPIQRPSIITPEDRRQFALSRMTELGRPVGECTASDLRNLIKKNVVNASYYNALLHGMSEYGTVSQYYSEAEAAKALHIARTAQGLDSALITQPKAYSRNEYHANA